MDNALLKSADLKSTKRRQAIFSVLAKANQPLTAEDIYYQVTKDVHMSVSTAYRALGAMYEKGIVLKNVSQDGRTYYQINNHQHKHHLVCTLCNQVLPVEECPLNDLEQALMKKTGYIITGHSLEFSGICPKCAEQMKKNS